MADYTVNYSPTVYEVYVSDGGARTYSDLAVTAHNADATAHAIQVNAQTGTTYQLVLADAGKVVQCTNVNPIALTVPLNATVAFAVGTVIGLRQGGAGLLTVAAAGGVTINSLDSSLAMSGQYANAALEKTATDTWALIGALA